MDESHEQDLGIHSESIQAVPQRPEQPEQQETQEQAAESNLDKMDRLEQELAELRGQEDTKLHALLIDTREWIWKENVDVWMRRQAELVFATQADGKNIQLHVNTDMYNNGGGIEVREFELDEGDDPSVVKSKPAVVDNDGHPLYYEPSSALKGSTGFMIDANLHRESVSDIKKGNNVVGFGLPVASHQYSALNSENAYGNYLFNRYEGVRNKPQEKERRRDPIAEGRRTLGLLRSAKLVGTFDEKTGKTEHFSE